MRRMNNTTISAIAAVLMAATLVLGGTLAATSAQSAFAYSKKKGSQAGSENGNTVTAQIAKQRGSVSGFDNDLEQEASNVICTHPGSNASCVSEGSEGAAAGGGGGGGGGGDNFCSDGLVRATATVAGITLSVCVLPNSIITPIPANGCPTGTVRVHLTAQDVDACATVQL
jgi:hypothetical protein